MGCAWIKRLGLLREDIYLEPQPPLLNWPLWNELMIGIFVYYIREKGFELRSAFLEESLLQCAED